MAKKNSFKKMLFKQKKKNNIFRFILTNFFNLKTPSKQLLDHHLSNTRTLLTFHLDRKKYSLFFFLFTHFFNVWKIKIYLNGHSSCIQQQILSHKKYHHDLNGPKIFYPFFIIRPFLYIFLHYNPQLVFIMR